MHCYRTGATPTDADMAVYAECLQNNELKMFCEPAVEAAKAAARLCDCRYALEELHDIIGCGKGVVDTCIRKVDAADREPAPCAKQLCLQVLKCIESHAVPETASRAFRLHLEISESWS